jgi:hypothetical protein
VKADANARVPPIAAVINDAYHVAQQWRYLSFVLTEAPDAPDEQEGVLRKAVIGGTDPPRRPFAVMGKRPWVRWLRNSSSSMARTASMHARTRSAFRSAQITNSGALVWDAANDR